MTVLFGYQPITRPEGMPPCPCGDNHVAMEASDDNPLAVTIRCWCGRKSTGTFDSLEEREQFVATATGKR